MNTLPHLTTSHVGETAIVSPQGDVDISTVDLLRSAFAGAVGPDTLNLVIDLTATTFVDSMAIGVMVGAARRVHDRGGWVRVVGPRPNIRKVLAITGLDKVFALYDTVDQAIAHGEPELV